MASIVPPIFQQEARWNIIASAVGIPRGRRDGSLLPREERSGNGRALHQLSATHSVSGFPSSHWIMWALPLSLPLGPSLNLINVGTVPQNIRERGWDEEGSIGRCFSNGSIPAISGKGETYGADGELYSSNLKTQSLAVWWIPPVSWGKN